MNATDRGSNSLPSKRRFQGMWQVVMFNPTFYLTVVPALLLSAFFIPIFPMPELRLLAWLGWGLASWWVLASVLASHWVYDLSAWPEGTWLHKALGDHAPLHGINAHAGFDETTLKLKAWLPASEIISLDLFDPQLLTEKSIHRARRYFPPLDDAIKGSFHSWPSSLPKTQVIFFLLTAHEFRRHHERVELFRQARLHLSNAPHSCIILAEHVRDTANFMAFGPGFLHFHSTASWQSAWTEAALEVTLAFNVTPWVRIWRLQPISTEPRS